jgi:ATP-dependent Clp protease ATP-binding subunit ClpA
MGLLRVSESLAARILQALGAPPPKDVGSLLSLEKRSTWQTLNQEYTQQFTRQARKAWMLAHEESRRLQDCYVGTHHLLLGLVAEGSGVAAAALAEMGVGLAQLREMVTPSYQAGDWNTPGSITLQPRMRQVIELASNEARRLNHHFLGTGHLLLALIREDGMASFLLEALKVDLNSLRRTLREVSDEESVQRAQNDEAPTDPGGSEGVYTYDASIASLERDLQSRELDKMILAAYPFTLESRTVLAHAQRPANNLGRRVEPEDVLVGLAGLNKSDGLVSKVLKDLGIDYARTFAAVEKRQEQEKQTASVVRVQSALCKAYLLLAVNEAEQRDGLGAPIKSEHLLLGLLREEQGSIADVLLDLGTSVRGVRTKLLEAMGDSCSEGPSEAGN